MAVGLDAGLFAAEEDLFVPEAGRVPAGLPAAFVRVPVILPGTELERVTFVLPAELERAPAVLAVPEAGLALVVRTVPVAVLALVVRAVPEAGFLVLAAFVTVADFAVRVLSSLSLRLTGRLSKVIF